MDAADAADSIQGVAEEAGADERFRKRAALVIGTLAMLLAIASLGGDNAGQEVTQANILATDTWAFFQARNIRQTSTQLAADELEVMLATRPDLSAEARADVQRRLEQYRATVARFESDPVGGEGKQELGVPVRGRAHRYVGSFYGQLGTGEAYPEGITVEALVELLRSLPDGDAELGCHPARTDGLAATGTMYVTERLVELRALCDTAVRDTVAAEGIELVTFGGLR